ncbi:hypothetical protein [Rhizobium leguminosarum]|uniref:hypothetical protein n=1 Tax=Rhizobium leguminosarum TaxID=384 RepID=UPI001AEA6D1D|nr:hypothetical protein [Rhizobium leguminosarum]MBP2445953.1 hypothetical protein [Rhizobium leguminosarum]
MAENSSTIGADGPILHTDPKSAGSESTLAITADGSKQHVADFVEVVDAGGVGDLAGQVDDFGSITEDVTYSDQDWGFVAWDGK